nr:hypothetical protein [Rhizorhabdus wittichii]
MEGLLFDHPMIAQLSIVGIADERLGQRAVAFVVPAADMQPTLKALTQWLDDKGVAKFKWPERLEIIDSLPMTPSGKVRKEELRALLTAQAPA